MIHGGWRIVVVIIINYELNWFLMPRMMTMMRMKRELAFRECLKREEITVTNYSIN